jgi:alkylated DNA repair protein alkB homolog 6
MDAACVVRSGTDTREAGAVDSGSVGCAGLLPRPEHVVVSPLRSCWLIPDYVTPREEAELLEKVDSPAARWTQLSGRRVQRLGGVVHETAGLLAAPLPKWVVERVVQRLQREINLYAGRPRLNHLLINAYEPGEGILPHQDGPLYEPLVAILSLGDHAVMVFTPHVDHAEMPTHRIWLPPRSLLLFTDDAYVKYLHSIDACVADDPATVCNPPPHTNLIDAPHPIPRTGRRVSLTCRTVLRVRRGLVPGT